MSSVISPASPARVQALLLPVGRIRKQRFRSHVDRLRRDAIVRLADISPDPRPDKSMFSPAASPDGVILYDFVTTVPPLNHMHLSPYETFQSPMVVVGIADAQDGDTSRDALLGHLSGLGEFSRSIPHVVLDRVLVFDAQPDQILHPPQRQIHFVPSASDSKSTTMKTLMCDFSSAFVAELSSLAQYILSLQNIETPKDRLPDDREESDWVSQQKADLIRRGSLPATLATSPTHQTGPGLGAHLEANTMSPTSRPTTPNELVRKNSLSVNGPTSPVRPTSSSKTKTAARDSSKDRRASQVASVQNQTEWMRNKLKCRQGIVIGTFYLQSGRWADALRELTDSTTRAKASNDHVWHAKGLENLLATMLLMAWAGVDFRIPAICQNLNEAHSSATNRPRTVSGSGNSFETANANQIKGLQQLSALVPDLVHTIANIYSRANNFIGEALPQLPFSMSIVRLSYLLAILNEAGGKLDSTAVRIAVTGAQQKGGSRKNVSISQGHKRELATLMYRAYPEGEGSTTISPSDHVFILSSMASVLAFGGLHRKHAMLIRETLSLLIPSLIQARKVGAAELGIHPAASLAALHGLNQDGQGDFASLASGDVEDGFHSLLEHFARTYGAIIPTRKTTETASDRTPPVAEATIMDLAEEQVLQSFGNSSLKTEVLRLCSNFSEAVPNFRDVVHFAGALLLAAGPVSAPNFRSTSTVKLSKDDQVRLSVKINRTLAVVRSVDLPKLETQYWDPYLVQDICFGEVPESDVIYSHPCTFVDGSSLTANGDSADFETSPPIPRNASIEDVVVAGDKTKVAVTLQNPYDFELIIEKLSLVCQGVKVRQSPASVVIGPRRYQTFNLVLMALEPGVLKVEGCIAKIQGCQEALFRIFSKKPSGLREQKIKHFGLASLGDRNGRPLSSDSQPAAKPPAQEPKNWSSSVIGPQPLLNVSSSTLSQSVVTILEGEWQSFTLTVRNISESVPVNFSRISFAHSLRESQMDTSKGLLGRTELYELEQLHKYHQPFVWRNSNTVRAEIPPGGSKTFHIDVIGRIGTTGGSVTLDYSHVDYESLSPTSRIYTRTISLPFSVTVNPSLQLQRIDVLPVSLPFAQSPEVASNPPTSTARESHTQALLLLDLKNASPYPLHTELTLNPLPTASPLFSTSSGSFTAPRSTTSTIQPARTARLAIPIPRLLLHSPYAQVPALQFIKERQFVVSDSEEISLEREREVLVSFWARLALLSMLNGSWKSLETPTRGSTDLRGIHLDPRMVTIVREDPVGIGLALRSSDSQAGLVQPEEFVNLTATLTNRMPMPVDGRVSLSIHLTGGGAEVGKNVIHQGKLEKWFRLQPGAQTEHRITLCVLVTGQWEVRCVVEERQAGKTGKAIQRVKETLGRGRILLDVCRT